MKINNRQENTSFRGYDAIPLKAFYMQGIRKPNEINIFREMKAIAKKEGIDIFVNTNNIGIHTDIPSKTRFNPDLSIWAQDNKAFVKNKFGKQVLWNSKEPVMQEELFKTTFADFELNASRDMPRGGDYYIGFKENGEKWILVNGSTMDEAEALGEMNGDPEKLIQNLFEVKSDNIFKLYTVWDDLDEVVRPVGFPYILVNNYQESLKNLDLMRKNFPTSSILYTKMKNFLEQKINMNNTLQATNNYCKELESFGFKPITIGARYIEDINFINAIAMKNNKNGISYITNSTKQSYKELEYLEQLFDRDLKSKVPTITNTHYVSGGKRVKGNPDSNIELYSRGLAERNGIMDILANRLGGIHCMTAEVPNFERII